MDRVINAVLDLIVTIRLIVKHDKVKHEDYGMIADDVLKLFLMLKQLEEVAAAKHRIELGRKATPRIVSEGKGKGKA